MAAHNAIMHFALQERKRLLHYEANYAFCMNSPNDRLRDARIKAGFEKAVDAADAMGVPRSTYIGHENGHRGFPASRAPAYARKFKVTEGWLLYGKDCKAPSVTLDGKMSISLDGLATFLRVALSGGQEDLYSQEETLATARALLSALEVAGRTPEILADPKLWETFLRGHVGRMPPDSIGS